MKKKKSIESDFIFKRNYYIYLFLFIYSFYETQYYVRSISYEKKFRNMLNDFLSFDVCLIEND